MLLVIKENVCEVANLRKIFFSLVSRTSPNNKSIFLSISKLKAVIAISNSSLSCSSGECLRLSTQWVTIFSPTSEDIVLGK